MDSHTTVKDAVTAHMMQRTAMSQTAVASATTVLPEDTLKGKEGTYRPHDVELPPLTNAGLPRQEQHFGLSPFECEEAERRRKEEERETEALKAAHW